MDSLFQENETQEKMEERLDITTMEVECESCGGKAVVDLDEDGQVIGGDCLDCGNSW